MDLGKRTHSRQFPLRKIEALVKIAVDNKLSLLQIGDVRIVPSGRTSSPETTEGTLKIIEEAQKRLKRPLTPEELQDEILFGPGGFSKVDE
jgi:DUF1009 family protein